LVNARPFAPALRLAGRPGAELAALAALVDSDPDDLQSVLDALAVTDARARDAAGAFAALPHGDQYHGSGAAAVMMPFLCPGESRFSSGRYGVLYGAESTETATAEVSYHHARRLHRAAAPSGTSVILALWAFALNADLPDLRGHDASIYHPVQYAPAQDLGQQLRTDGAAGILYSSVRRPSGECVGVFKPRVVDSMEKHDDWRLVWDGNAISEVLRSA
jgi:RES domain-containing protein